MTTLSPTASPVRGKTCNACGERKPHSAFLPCRALPEGLTARCRRCIFTAADADRRVREQRAQRRVAGVRA